MCADDFSPCRGSAIYPKKWRCSALPDGNDDDDDDDEDDDP
jgi:hypothetical protein